MKNVHELEKRYHSLKTLSEAVSAMKSLTAHHFRQTRNSLPAARAYEEMIERIVACIDLPRPEREHTSRGVLLIAGDLGLCGGYNTQLLNETIEYFQQNKVARFYCVGQRPVNGLSRAGISVSRQYQTPTSVDGLTEVLLQLVQDVMVDYLDEKFESLDVISAKFEGVGQFQPVTTSVLPVEISTEEKVFDPSPYVDRDHLVAVALREYLFIQLFQSLLDSLASENGARMLATQSAGDWLSNKLGTNHRQLMSMKREAATQEVLEIAASLRGAPSDEL
ncbi:MAG: F0F1 ATP synthase subunit gamma [Planctomycetaceae bacterium]|nr:F0F1 ATP synthase subunit gamma [Planctomycetaceae bacterium]